MVLNTCPGTVTGDIRCLLHCMYWTIFTVLYCSAVILCLNLVSGRQLARMAGTENAAPVDQGGHVGVTIPLYVIPGARFGIRGH